VFVLFSDIDVLDILMTINLW